MLRIDITPYEDGLHHVELDPEAEALDLDPERFSDLHVDVRLDVQRKRILAMLEARATVALTCDRTLRDFEQDVSGSYSLLFAPAAFARANEGDDAYDEVRVLEPGDREIDLTDAVRDTLLLAVPQRKIAPGAEDVDLQTVYGRPEDEDDVDPRWEALRKLRADDGATSS